MDAQTQNFCEKNKDVKEDEDNNKNIVIVNNVWGQRNTRWRPTTRQLEILKDLYCKKGVRCLSTEQIQWILPILRQFGRIEGKNVFYWFQNYKAREKQMRLRRGRLYAASTNHVGSRCDNSMYNNDFLDHKMKSSNKIQEENLMPQQRQEGDKKGRDDEKRSKLKTLPLFPMHGDSVFTNFCSINHDAHARYNDVGPSLTLNNGDNALMSDSQVYLELSLGLYNGFN